jgi:hypothetical protein
VLNGSGVSGLAHQTAEQARGMGYAQISEGNAPSTVTATKVYFRPGGAPEARQVAQDLNLPTPTRIPANGALDKAADAPAHVVVVLGPDAQIGSDPTATGTRPRRPRARGRPAPPRRRARIWGARRRRPARRGERRPRRRPRGRRFLPGSPR